MEMVWCIENFRRLTHPSASSSATRRTRPEKYGDVWREQGWALLLHPQNSSAGGAQGFVVIALMVLLAHVGVALAKVRRLGLEQIFVGGLTRGGVLAPPTGGMVAPAIMFLGPVGAPGYAVIN